MRNKFTRVASVLIAMAPLALGQDGPPSLPDAPGKDTVQRVCGACHPATIVVGHGMSREGWAQTVSNMISRGAKGSATDFAAITDYLAKNLPPGTGTAGGRKPRRGGSGFAAGPSDKQVVDEDAALKGKALYSAQCASCHGAMARGGQQGSDLVRSVVVLHDRYGSELKPYLADKHPEVGGKRFAALTDEQGKELSHFLHQQVQDTLRSGPYTKVLNVLTGDAKRGAAYFSGDGECGKCHSTSGDLAGVAKRYDPPTLQQRMLFPRVGALGRGPSPEMKPIKVTVTADGHTVSGTLLRMDDFDVAMRDDAGNYRSWKRTPDVKVEVSDPYAGHDELLDRVSDQNIHDLVAYLETLK